MRVLITGGAGFIGQRLATDLLNRGMSVRILDNFSPQIHQTETLPAALSSHVELIKADVRNRDAMQIALTGVDSVVHLAAETGTGQSMYEIERYFSVNVMGTAELVDLLQNDPCGKSVQNLVVASSRAVYGEGAYSCVVHGTVHPEQRQQDAMVAGDFEPICPHCHLSVSLLPTSESSPFKPMSIYGLTKQVQEQTILMLARTRGINAFALRYQNVFGPGQSLKNPYTGILAVFSNLARASLPIEVYEDGKESRDFVFVDDVVSATSKCVAFTDRFIGALNIGSGVATPVIDVAKAIRKYFNSESVLRITGASRMGDIRHNVADVTKAKVVLSFSSTISFEKGLIQFLDWASTQPLENTGAYRQAVDELRGKGLMNDKAGMS